MEARDGQVPAPRRPALPRLRRPAAGPAASPTALPFVVPGHDDEPRVADLSALLADIDALRLTLQTDLSLAAAAVEAGADELAGELVDGDLTELRAFAARSADRLESLAAGDGADQDGSADDVELPAVAPLRRRRILTAGPLMAAAAAVIGFVAFVPGRGATVPDTSITSAALAGYELSRLAQEGAPDEELREAAEELNDELAELIEQAASDPAAAQQALMLLEQTTQVLSTQGDSGVLRGVIAETRALRDRLREALPVTRRATRPARTVARQVVPILPRVESAPQRERTSEASQKSSPKPAATTTTAPKASPTPTPAQPSAAPTPTSQPSPQPSEAPDGPLPGYDGLPGS